MSNQNSTNQKIILAAALRRAERRDRRPDRNPRHPENDGPDAPGNDAKHAGKDEGVRLHSFGNVTADDAGLRRSPTIW